MFACVCAHSIHIGPKWLHCFFPWVLFRIPLAISRQPKKTSQLDMQCTTRPSEYVACFTTGFTTFIYLIHYPNSWRWIEPDLFHPNIESSEAFADQGIHGQLLVERPDWTCWTCINTLTRSDKPCLRLYAGVRTKVSTSKKFQRFRPPWNQTVVSPARVSQKEWTRLKGKRNEECRTPTTYDWAYDPIWTGIQP